MEDKQKANITYGLSLLGSVSGLALAAKEKRGFWRYVGYSLAGGALGSGLGMVFFPTKENYLDMQQNQQLNEGLGEFPGLYTVLFGNKDIPISYESEEPLPLDIEVKKDTREMVLGSVLIVSLAAVVIFAINKK